MIADIDYGATEPQYFSLKDQGVAFDGSGFTVALELLASGAMIWTAATDYVAGDIVRPLIGNGRIYQAIVGGTSGTVEPTWPTSSGGTVVDGTAEWEEITPVAAWDDQAGGIVEVTGVDALPPNTSFRARFRVTDNFGSSGYFPNRNRYDVWRVGATMRG